VKALLSVYDKTGVVDLAKALHDLGCDLVSSGGTAKAVADAGIPVVDTAELTGFPAILGHRVVTLHPRIHGGILADPTDESHRADMDEHGIEPFDLVVINAYPFGSDPADFAHGGNAGAMDVLDIGGPAMIRAAAKNHAHVGIVTDPSDYDEVLDELRAEGKLSDGLRRRLARKAFAFTAAYDAGIVQWFDSGAGSDDEPEPRPETINLSYRREPVALRYGENPHQAAALYRSAAADPWWAHVEVHGGMALSYLNLFDADAAWLLAHDLEAATGKPAVAIIKHANPCGAAVADVLGDAYQLAFDCDPRSAFGGIVALSDPVDDATVEAMVAAAQADLVIAPDYGPGVIDALLKKRKNTRILKAPPPTPDERHIRPITGGLLVQDPHRFLAQRADWRVVTQRQPTDAEWVDAELAWRVCGHTKSNAIVLAKDGVAWGIGAGQQNRVESGEIAAKKADGRAAGGACASDAFYPFPDGIEAAAGAGVAVIIQPGGSVKDEVNIARADELGVAMVFTGERHFVH
jgi:phosphoribosylaminoimidazolecarboxamide formyltransferase/IMP cyclohydrolase